MVLVAVAGGGKGIGLDIVQAILDTKKHEVVVLSRSKPVGLSLKDENIHLVDYQNADQLKDLLKGVHTVISCIAAYGNDATAAELALLEAAKEAAVTRFVPSEWGSGCNDIVDFYSDKGVVWQAVQSSGLEYTRFLNGLWMNVWGSGCVRNEEEAVAGYGSRPAFIIDLKAGTAVLPGDPTKKIVVTRMQDVGRFVAAALDLPTWTPETRVSGDRLTIAAVVGLAKSVCGKELQATELPIEKLEQILQGTLTDGERFYYQLLLAIATGRMDFTPESNAIFPDVKPMSTAEYFQRYWTMD